MASVRSHYDLLGVDRDADDSAVKRAWKVLVQVWHPDRFSGDMRETAEQTTARINEAYHVLRDSSRRAAYDRKLDADAAAAAAMPAMQPRPRVAFATSSPFALQERANARARAAGGGPSTAAAVHDRPLAEVADEFARELWVATRRNPRLSAVAATVLVLFVGWALLTMIFMGPSLPAAIGAASATTTVPLPTARSSAPSYTSADDLELDHAAEEASAPADGGLPSDAELGLAPQEGLMQGPLPEEMVVPRPHAVPRRTMRSLPTRGARRGHRVVRVHPMPR